MGKGPWTLAMAPNGKTVYVVDQLSRTVTPIATATDKPGKPIPVGNDPLAIAITPAAPPAQGPRRDDHLSPPGWLGL